MESIRVATWNLNGRADPTWSRLLGLSADADVALVQEAAPPSANWRHTADAAVWPALDAEPELRTPNNVHPARVVALTANVDLRGRSLPDARSHRRTLAVADVLAGTERLMTVASAYGMFEERDISDRSMHRILDDLAPLLSAPSPRLVLGGDFNMWIQPWRGGPWPPYQRAFERMSELGLIDCLQIGVGPERSSLVHCPRGGSNDCTHVRTLRHMNRAASIQWQVDYLFASDDLRPPRLQACRLIDTDDIWAASDHCAIVADFHLT